MATSDRRKFLKSTAAVGALAAAGSYEPILQAPRKGVIAGDPIGVGVIGVGGMGHAHCISLLGLAQKKLENFKVLAVSDVCKPRLERAQSDCAQKQGIEVGAYRYYRELLARKDIDAVFIASPEHWHAQMSIDAIQAGKDVYVEKPMTLDLADGIRLYDVARNADRIVQVGTQYVTDPKYRKAFEVIAAGGIGKPCSSETGYCRNSKTGEWNYYGIDKRVVPGEMLDWDAWCGPLGPQPFNTLIYHRWRRYKKYSTGIVGDLLVHQLTPLMWAIDQGWPTKVVATGGHYVDHDMENFDQVNLTIQFEKGHTMVVWGSTCNASGPAPMVRGHKANLHLSGNRCSLTPENIYSEDLDKEDWKFDSSGSQDELRLDFLKAVRSRGGVLSPIELGLKVMVIVDLAARSMWEGKAFSYDPKTMTARAD
jgi:predicted dehydrogenase